MMHQDLNWNTYRERYEAIGTKHRNFYTTFKMLSIKDYYPLRNYYLANIHVIIYFIIYNFAFTH